MVYIFVMMIRKNLSVTQHRERLEKAVGHREKSSGDS